MKEELRKCAGEIRAARQEMLRCQAELDGVDSARDAKAALLAAALAKVRLMEEDLAGATRRQAEVAAQLAPLMELEKKVSTRQEAIAALQKQLPALDAQLAAGQESLQARTLELAEVKARLDALAAARKTFDAAVEAALGSTAKQKPDKAGDAPPPKQPPAKKK